MSIQKTSIWSITVLVFWLALAAPLTAVERLTVFGDSWGVGTFLGLENVFAPQAPGQSVVSGAIAGELAGVMNSDDPDHGLPYLASTIAAHPIVDLIHFSIGGNDLLFNWNLAKQLGTEDLLLDSIANDIEAIVLHTLEQRPNLEVFYSTYDYMRPLPNYLVTPFEINTAFEELQDRVESRLANIPRATTHSFYGLMQILYGYSPDRIPPGDPSLPDIHLPAPPDTFFDEIHLTWDMGDGSPGPFGFDQLAQAQFDVFYRSRIVPEPTTSALLLLGATACLGRRRQRS